MSSGANHLFNQRTTFWNHQRALARFVYQGSNSFDAPRSPTVPTRDNVHPISDADLDAHRDDAEFRMQNVPMRGVSYDVLGELRKLPGIGGYLLSEPANHVLHALRHGLCLYYELYEELSA